MILMAILFLRVLTLALPTTSLLWRRLNTLRSLQQVVQLGDIEC
jgi:hypothetical protein